VQTSEALEAYVLSGTPASEAGIRDGDALLKIDALDTTKWRTDPTVLPLARFWERSAGTKLTLLLKRDGKELSVTVTLRDLIGPGVKARVAEKPAANPSR
jgi:C-terminal processing protease CtpA/Prc